MNSTNDQQIIALDAVNEMKAGMIVAELTSKEYSMFYPGIDDIVSKVRNSVMYFMGMSEEPIVELSDIKTVIRTISETDVDGRDIRVSKLLNSMKRISIIMMRNYDLLKEYGRSTRLTSNTTSDVSRSLDTFNTLIKIAEQYNEIVDRLWLQPRAVLDEIIQKIQME